MRLSGSTKTAELHIPTVEKVSGVIHADEGRLQAAHGLSGHGPVFCVRDRAESSLYGGNDLREDLPFKLPLEIGGQSLVVDVGIVRIGYALALP